MVFWKKKKLLQKNINDDEVWSCTKDKWWSYRYFIRKLDGACPIRKKPRGMVLMEDSEQVFRSLVWVAMKTTWYAQILAMTNTKRTLVWEKHTEFRVELKNNNKKHLYILWQTMLWPRIWEEECKRKDCTEWNHLWEPEGQNSQHHSLGEKLQKTMFTRPSGGFQRELFFFFFLTWCTPF